MKINIKPSGYLAPMGNDYPAFATANKLMAENAAAYRGSYVEPLHPESLVIELAEALAGMDEAYCNAGSEMSREDRHTGRVALIKARALFARITDGSES